MCYDPILDRILLAPVRILTVKVLSELDHIKASFSFAKTKKQKTQILIWNMQVLEKKLLLNS